MGAVPGDRTAGVGLLERGAELNLIEDTIGLAAAGNGSTLLIQGPAGIGKSALCAAAAEIGATTGALCLRCRGSRLERGFAFGAIRTLISPAISGARPDDPDGLFAGAARLALRAVGLDSGPPERDDSISGEAALHGLYWLWANLADRQPLLMIVDDAQWIDQPSLDFVSYLSRRVRDLPVALILAVRSEDPDARAPALADVRSDPEVNVITLAPLGAEASGTLIRSELAGAETSFVEACHEASGGNPFLLRTLLAHLSKAGVPSDASGVEAIEVATPEAVSDWIGTRLERLGEMAARLSRALAVFDAPTELYLCAELAGIDRGETLATADRLREAEILAATELLEFTHPLVGEAVAASISAAERSDLEMRAAELLIADGAPAGEVGAHLLATEPGGEEWVFDSLLEAGRQAIAGGAPESAVRFLNRAAREPGAKQRSQLWMALGRAQIAIDPTAAREPIERAFELAGPASEKAESALLVLRLRDTQGRSHEAVPQLDEVIAALPDGDLRDRLEAGLISAAQLHTSTSSLGIERLLAAGERIGEGEPSNFGEAAILANLAFGASVTCMADASRVRELCDRSLAHGRLTGEQALVPLSYLGAALTFSDRPVQARALLDDSMAAARDAGLLVIARTLAGIKATATLHTGRASEAVAEAELARGDLSEDTWAEVPVSASPMIEALVWRGELDQAEIVAATYPLDDPPAIPYALRASASWAKLLIARGQDAQALDLLTEIGSRFDSMGLVHPLMADWRGPAAIAAHRLQRDERAAELATAELELARRAASSAAAGRALVTAGRIAEGREGLDLLEQAVDELSASESRLFLAEAKIELGAALRRARRRSDAVEQLRGGLDLAAGGQISALAARARDELERTGLRPRRELISGPESLTPSERQIAEMAAAGKRNREIAQELFLTLRTVETHLTHTYAKLEIGSRRELASALAAS